MAMSQYRNLPYDAIRDFAPVTLAAAAPNILVVNPAFPARTAKELLDIASFNDLSEADIPGIGCGNHDQDVVATDPKEIEPFELPGNQAIRNLLDDAYPMVGVNNFIAYLKCVHRPPKNRIILTGVPGPVKGIVSLKPRPTRISAYLVHLS